MKFDNKPLHLFLQDIFLEEERRQMVKCLEWFDQFGALFQMKIFNQDHEFRTPYGGLVSLLIYVSITVYSTYLGILWQTKQIPPTVVSKLTYVPQGMYLNMTSRLFILGISNDQATDELHELETKGYLYNVKGIYYGLNNVIKPMKMNPKNYGCGLERTSVDFFAPICLNPQEQEQKWLYQDATRFNDVYFDYYISYCDPEVDAGCLSKKDSAPFFTEDTTWRLTTIMQDVNLQTGEILDIPTDYYYLIDPKESIDIQIKVVKAVLQIDDGFIFPNIRVIEIVKEIKLFVSKGPQQQEPGLTLSISMERYQMEIQIQFVKLATIIADITSWLQTLLLIGYFLSMINNDLLHQKVKEALFNMYFPQCRSYQLEYNWRKKVKRVQRDGELLNKQEAKQFLDFRQRMFLAIQTQFNHLHLLSQINKMQIALQLMMPKPLIRQLRSIDYQMKVDRSPIQFRHPSDQIYLDEDDFLMFQQLSSAATDFKVHPLDNETNSPLEIERESPMYGNSLMNLAPQIKPQTSDVKQTITLQKVCIEDVE